jgi:lipopolysaccharide export system protein LptC
MLKPNKIRQLLAFAIIFTVLSLAVTIAVKLYLGRRSADKSVRVHPTADISLQKIHYTETRKGRKQWDLLAETAEYHKDKELTHLTGVRLVVAGNTATGDLTLNADMADYHNASGDVDLAGNVRAGSVSGMEFATSSAGYRSDREVIVSSEHVRFSDGRLSVEGVGMELAVDSRRVRIGGGVTANIAPGKKGK